jgi:acyl carrier protein
MSNVEAKVCQIVANALYLDVSEVNLESNLLRELGAESIDLLDIVFRLEKEFSIKIPRDEFERRARGGLSKDEFAANGILTLRGMAEVRKNMPELSLELLDSGFMLRDLASLFTVASFVRIIEEQISPKAKSSQTHIPNIDPVAARRGSATPAINFESGVN